MLNELSMNKRTVLTCHNRFIKPILYRPTCHPERIHYVNKALMLLTYRSTELQIHLIRVRHCYSKIFHSLKSTYVKLVMKIKIKVALFRVNNILKFNLIDNIFAPIRKKKKKQ